MEALSELLERLGELEGLIANPEFDLGKTTQGLRGLNSEALTSKSSAYLKEDLPTDTSYIEHADTAYFEDEDDALSTSITDKYCSIDHQLAASNLYDALEHQIAACQHGHIALLRLSNVITGHLDDGIDVQMILSSSAQLWVECQFCISQSQRYRYNGSQDQKLNLCELIETAGMQFSRLRATIRNGVLTASEPSISTGGYPPSTTIISLATLVSRTHQVSTQNLILSRPLLKLKPKIGLAVTLAYNIWHLSLDSWLGRIVHNDNRYPSLDEGPWLQRNWKHDGFKFLEHGRVGQRQVDMWIPYLQAIFSPMADTDAARTVFHPSPTILAFGIVMIHLFSYELFHTCRAEILEEYAEEGQNIDTESLNLDHHAAMRLLERQDFFDELDERPRRIITTCIESKCWTTIINSSGDFDDSTTSEQHAKMVREAFYQKVICPLKRWLKQSCGWTPDSFGDSKSAIVNLNTPLPAGLNTSNGYEIKCYFTHNGKVKTIDNEEAVSADDWISKYKDEVFARIRPKYNQKPIKVAILDTGIDLPEQASNIYEDQLAGWFSGLKEETLHRDEDGHGTHCASLLLKTGLNISLFVARVFRNSTERRDQTGIKDLYTRIEKAIDHAIDEWEVDIITLSFGFSNPVSGIRKAIKRAASKNILVFAAASNCGARGNIAFPASMDDVICIHATDGDGNRAKFSPSPLRDKVNFATLGCAVEGYWSRQVGGEVKRRASGTSCATPIAAGIAATVLGHIDHLRSIHTDFDLDQEKMDLLDMLREREGMEKLLLAMVDRKSKLRDGYHCIQPWRLFAGFDDLRDNDEEQVRFLNHILTILQS